MIFLPPRQLLLLRHAKSSWDDLSLDDHDRPLNKRGRKAAAAMREEILSRGLAPDLALVSTALRARQTWEALSPWPQPPAVAFTRELYHAPPTTMLDLVRQVEDSARSVMIVGHNPGLMELAILLIGADESVAARRLVSRYPTAALALFELDGPWAGLGADSAALKDFVVPKELKPVD
jgi:phosphohistidine phosphatase